MTPQLIHWLLIPGRMRTKSSASILPGNRLPKEGKLMCVVNRGVGGRVGKRETATSTLLKEKRIKRTR